MSRRWQRSLDAQRASFRRVVTAMYEQPSCKQGQQCCVYVLANWRDASATMNASQLPCKG